MYMALHMTELNSHMIRAPKPRRREPVSATTRAQPGGRTCANGGSQSAGAPERTAGSVDAGIGAAPSPL